jgi:hypothetical protein
MQQTWPSMVDAELLICRHLLPSQLGFRGLLSTCNVINSREIEVITDEALLWITEIAEGVALRPSEGVGSYTMS